MLRRFAGRSEHPYPFPQRLEGYETDFSSPSCDSRNPTLDPDSVELHPTLQTIAPLLAFRSD